MPKKTRDDDAVDGEGVSAPKGERMPPPLSDELIAKLHGAVDAARRRRMQQAEPGKAPRIEFVADRHAADPEPAASGAEDRRTDAPRTETPRYRGKDRRASKRS
jgi:hypothetical protein